jgi:hypothetical protein
LSTIQIVDGQLGKTGSRDLSAEGQEKGEIKAASRDTPLFVIENRNQEE